MNQFIRKISAIFFWIGLWAIAAAVINKPLLLPSPINVALRIASLISTTTFWSTTILSLLRIMTGIISAVLLGVVLATVTTHSRILSDLFSPILTVIKVTPVASFIILALIWVGRDYVPAVISALMVLPIICNNVSAGLRNINPQLLELAKVYRLPRFTRFYRITIPSVMPYFLSAIQSSIGIGWKAGIAAEVLTVPALSIGKMIFESKMYMETVDLFAWTLVVIVISLVIETVLLKTLKQISKKYNGEVK